LFGAVVAAAAEHKHKPTQHLQVSSAGSRKAELLAIDKELAKGDRLMQPPQHMKVPLLDGNKQALRRKWFHVRLLRNPSQQL
jgi:hypothetical protein